MARCYDGATGAAAAGTVAPETGHDAAADGGAEGKDADFGELGGDNEAVPPKGHDMVTSCSDDVSLEGFVWPVIQRKTACTIWATTAKAAM